MFRGLLNDAKSAISSLILKYLARASVAVPFLIADGFAIAAITLMLVDQYGHITAYWIMAGGLALIGAIAALVVSVKEQEDDAAEKVAEESEAATSSATAAVAEAASQAPLAVLGALSALPVGPTSFMPAVRLLARNLPLVVLLALIALLFWPTETTEAAGEEQQARDDDEEASVRHANGADPLPSEMRH
jgi:hypothetical protein